MGTHWELLQKLSLEEGVSKTHPCVLQGMGRIHTSRGPEVKESLVKRKQARDEAKEVNKARNIPDAWPET